MRNPSEKRKNRFSQFFLQFLNFIVHIKRRRKQTKESNLVEKFSCAGEKKNISMKKKKKVY